MKMFSIGLLPAATLALAGCAASPIPVAVPSADPASAQSVAVEELGAGEQDAAVDVELDRPARVAFRRIILSPGREPDCTASTASSTASSSPSSRRASSRTPRRCTRPVYPTGVHEYVAGEPLARTDLTNCDR